MELPVTSYQSLSHNLLDSTLYTAVLRLKTLQEKLRLYAFCDG
jgi:hypothetical protein